MAEQQYRKERDSMGEFQVPADAYYGANTMRAKLNFPISDLRFPGSFISGFGTDKAGGGSGELRAKGRGQIRHHAMLGMSTKMPTTLTLS